MKGQKMLKVCSILMIVFAALSIVFAVVALGVFAILIADGEGTLRMLAIAASVLVICGVAFELAAGIVGVKAAGMPSVGKIKAAFVLGILVLVVCLASNFVSLYLADFALDLNTIGNFVLGIILPVLYLIGLVRYKNALVELLSDGE